jgi:hypothetical protein
LAGVTAVLGIDGAELTDVEFAVEFVTALNVYRDPFAKPETTQDPFVSLVVAVHVAPVTAVPVLSYA